MTGRTRLTWTDVRHVRRPAPPAAGDPARPDGSGVRTTRLPRPGRHGSACPSRSARGWRRPRPSPSGPCRATTFRCPCAGSPASPPRSGPGWAGRAARRDGGLRRVPRLCRRLVGGAPSRGAHAVRGRPLGGRRRGRARREPGAADAVALAARRGEAVELRAERDEALARVDKLTSELERLRAELADARDAARFAGQEWDAEYQQLRRRVSDQGTRLRAALDGRAAAERALEELRVSAEADRPRSPPSATGSASARRPSGAGRPTPSPRSRRPGRPRGRRGSPTRSASACCSTPSAARWPGCAASWPWAAGVRVRETWWRVRGRSAAVAPSTR